MDERQKFKSTPLQMDLETIANLVHQAAQQRQGNSLELLKLLRLLESLHQEIRDGLFQPSLPDNRQALYALLKDIEADGGWPYIYRMKLQEFLANFAQDISHSVGHSAHSELSYDRSLQLPEPGESLE